MTRLRRAQLTREHEGLNDSPEGAACPGSQASGPDEDLSDAAWAAAGSDWRKAHEIMASLLMDGQPGGSW